MHKRYRLMSQRQLHLHNGFAAWKGEAEMSLSTSPGPKMLAWRGRDYINIYIYICTNTQNEHLTQHLKCQSSSGEAQTLDFPFMAPAAVLPPHGTSIKGYNLTCFKKKRTVLHQSPDSWVLSNGILFFLPGSTVMDQPAFLLNKDFFFK